MFLSNKSFLSATALLAVLCFTQCNNDAKKKEAEEKARMDSTMRADSMAKMEAENAAKNAAMAPKNIVDFAVEHAKTLAAAITAADLAETLKGAGPFTVFAPTDEAFSAIQKDVDNLLKPENKAKLQSVLKHHVVSGNVKSTDLKDGQEVTTLEGTKLKVKIKDGKVMIGDAEVVTADQEASNGTVHVINKVLLPKK